MRPGHVRACRRATPPAASCASASSRAFSARASSVRPLPGAPPAAAPSTSRRASEPLSSVPTRHRRRRYRRGAPDAPSARPKRPRLADLPGVVKRPRGGRTAVDARRMAVTWSAFIRRRRRPAAPGAGSWRDPGNLARDGQPSHLEGVTRQAGSTSAVAVLLYLQRHGDGMWRCGRPVVNGAGDRSGRAPYPHARCIVRTRPRSVSVLGHLYAWHPKEACRADRRRS